VNINCILIETDLIIPAKDRHMYLEKPQYHAIFFKHRPFNHRYHKNLHFWNGHEKNLYEY
jgi:hypothetical protein